MSVRNIVLIVIAIVAGALVYDALYVVDERERALVLKFGEISKQDVPSGLGLKIPLAENVVKFDGRILTLDSTPERFYTQEKKPLIVDSFAKWRIGDVSKYYTSTSGLETRARSILTDRVNEGLRNQIGSRSMHDVISSDREELMQDLTASLDRVMMTEMGIEVIDVRVKKIDLPDEVSTSVFARMNSEREIEARQYRAEGEEVARGIRADAEREAVVIEADAYKEAEQIRGDGDAKAANVYAAAFGADKEFYAFYRSVNAYAEIFKEQNSTLVIDPSSEFFRFLKSKE